MKHALLSESEQLSVELGSSGQAELYEIKPTNKVQMQSLLNFAFMLGYELTNFPYEVNYFYSEHLRNKHRKTISVFRMIQAHNGLFVDTHGKRMKAPFDFSEEHLKAAWSQKLVAKVKMQYSKKTHKFVVQNHVVEFTKEFYQEIFV